MMVKMKINDTNQFGRVLFCVGPCQTDVSLEDHLRQLLNQAVVVDDQKHLQRFKYK